MEEALLLVSERVCARCGVAYKMQCVRYGCVFACRCAAPLDGQGVLARYCARLRDAGVPRPSFVPYIEGNGAQRNTWQAIGVVTVQCVVDEHVVHVDLANVSSAVQHRILAALSRPLREQLVAGTSGTHAYTAPASLLDVLVSELHDVMNSGAVAFVVNAPALGDVPRTRDAAAVALLLRGLPWRLRHALRPHQVAGVSRVLAFSGRALIADDMGVGKTLEALGVVAALRAYPLLLVCPSALKCMWAQEVERYLYEHVEATEVVVVHGANDAPAADAQPRVVITSYHMAATLRTWLRHRTWRCLLCDESHLLHTTIAGNDAVYTRVLTDIGARATYCLLLSGTPARAGVFDLYNQVDMLRPRLLGATRWHMALRYCHVRMQPHLQVLECTRADELAALLRSTCMLRRTRRQVLDLPAKTRVVLRVRESHGTTAVTPTPRSSGSDDEDSDSEARDGDERRGGGCAHNDHNDDNDNDDGGDKTRGGHRARSFASAYASAWRGKWPGIVDAVLLCLAKHDQVVLFAHHIALLDALQRLLRQRRVRHMRIDGAVPAAARDALLHDFARGAVRVALVGVTACAVGVSLATASCAVFCELPPDAASLRQAESRLHRPGQTREVTVVVVLGVHSLVDARHFARLYRHDRDARCCLDDDDGDDAGALTLSHALHTPSPPLLTTAATTTAANEVTAASSDAAVAERCSCASPPLASASAVSAVGDDARDAGGPGTDAANAPLLQFRVSKNTGLVHVRGDSGSGSSSTGAMARYYATYTLEEAHTCVQQRRGVVWRSLDTFLAALAAAPGMRRRRLIATSEWVWCDLTPCAPLPPPQQQQHDATSTTRVSANVLRARTPRYATTRPVVGWLMWWRVRRSHASTHDYAARLTRRRGTGDEDVYTPHCLACDAALCERRTSASPPPRRLRCVRPGDVVVVDTDVDVFCDGACRERFYVAWSGGAIRRSVHRVDDGVCAHCGVDAAALCARVALAPTRRARWRVVAEHHPLLLHFPALVRRLARDPVAGNCWHADHITPVARGGGAATLSNLQTLCVACHAMKTRQERVSAAAAVTLAAANDDGVVSTTWDEEEEQQQQQQQQQQQRQQQQEEEQAVLLDGASTVVAAMRHLVTWPHDGARRGR